MSCRQALDIDLSAYLVEADQRQWTDFRLHYPTCRECSREVARATAVVSEISDAAGEAGEHPNADQMLRWADASERMHREDAARIAAHVERCKRCSVEVAALRGFDFERMQASTGSGALSVEPPTALRWARARSLAPKWALAAGLALAWAIGLLLYYLSRDPERETELIAGRVVESETPASAALELETEPKELPEEEPPPAVVVAALDPSGLPRSLPHYAPAAGSTAPGRYVFSLRDLSLPDPPQPELLAPEEVAQTVSAKPSLYWFLPAESPYPLEFSLVAPDSTDPLLAVRFDAPVTAGFHAVRLAAYEIHLESGVDYEWSLSVHTGEGSPVPLAAAVLRRGSAAPELAHQLEGASVGEVAHIYAAEGYWYDAIDAFTSVVADHPAADTPRRHRAALLDQVGLKEAAAFDRRAAEK